MKLEELKICNNCHFVQPEGNTLVCPECGSSDLVSISKIQTPLENIDKIQNWFERLEPDFKDKLVDLIAFSKSKTERNNLILRLSNLNKTESKPEKFKNSELTLILNENTKIFRIKLKNKPKHKKKSGKRRILDKNSKIKPHFTTDEFDATMTSTRGMPEATTEGILPDNTVKALKLGARIGTAALSFYLPPNVSKTSEIDDLKNTRPPISILQTQNKRNIVDIIARTIFAEAKGESFRGKLGVASVIWNRAHGNPEEFIQVIRQNKQFSPWNNGIPPRGDGQTWDESIQIANNMVNGNFEPIFNYTHFLNPELVIKHYGKLPTWARKSNTQVTELKDKHIRIGNHVFLFDT